MRRAKKVLIFKSPMINRRLHLFLLLCSAAFTLLIFQLWSIQVYQFNKFQSLAERNVNRKVPIPSKRGMIYDRKGRILAEDIHYWNVWIPILRDKGKKAVTQEIKSSLELLSHILDVPYEGLEHRYLVNRREQYYKYDRICVEERIPHDKYVTLLERRIEFPPDAQVYPEEILTRYYRYSDSASHLIGRTGEIGPKELAEEKYATYKSGDRIGIMGIENQYESYLRGIDGLNQVYVDKYEIQRNEHAIEIHPAVPGNNVVLSIDIELQQAAERILGSSHGVIIVADPRDTALLAMAVSPRFDLNRYTESLSTAQGSSLYNLAISGKYPPGSIIKVFEIFALMEEMKMSPSHTEFCPGAFNLPGTKATWRCHLKYGHGRVDMIQAVAYSCDVFFYKTVGMSLGIDRLANWMGNFGFMEKTGIDLPNESFAPYPSKATVRNWYAGDTINCAIGQGKIQLTPLQITTAVCAIANQGTLYRPRLAQKIVSVTGETVKTLEPVVNGKIKASSETWETVRRGMWEVVQNPRGTGRRVYDKDFILAGKTGTAEVGIKGKLPHAWFICYGPFENPEIVIVVLLENSGHGGEIASPLAKQLLDVYLGNDQQENLVRI